VRVALINAPLKSAVCDYGVGHQMPLGLLMVAGALRDQCELSLIDAACDHLSDSEIVRRVAAFGADAALVAHVGSTQSHPCCVKTMTALKDAMPSLVTVYGGVHPTYHAREILEQHRQVDFIVRGEGEVTTRELFRALASGDDLSDVDGVVWRRRDEVVINPTRAPLETLDTFPIDWDLIGDWDRYRAFGLGRAAVAQFSRGCPHICTYCGQWMFWKRWRHRDVSRFVDELQWLRRERNVRFVWIADENPTTLKDVWKAVLQEIADRELGLSMCASIRAQDIVRDRDILHLYRAAGFVYVLMGVETVTDDTLTKIRKNSLVDDAYQAVRLLRQHGILSIVDYIFGLEEETPATIWRALRGLIRYDGDFVNALYVTPHSWTPLGRAMRGAAIVEPDLWKWDYRHQVVGVKHLTPAQLLLGVKLVELLYHLRPRPIWRTLTAREPRVRRLLRHSAAHVAGVYFCEVFDGFRDVFRQRSDDQTRDRVRHKRTTERPTGVPI
jgi:anaerobic magnesium-protoporphyrin IX monomethyl ester cyclase